ncbi:hypothetical protein PILCRDRAFT_108974 [Piloderma croceum F 1598]|uniref:Uncharacterized protein n=1 Tax=Piloderma croceum (strain F 1598) TaxID=765440 RepID=A0A0C3G716_PILCF|nr:hypothetical protein PILCRDRAFT_108974 [Piloderma croceum F 1598]
MKRHEQRVRQGAPTRGCVRLPSPGLCEGQGGRGGGKGRGRGVPHINCGRHCGGGGGGKRERGRNTMTVWYLGGMQIW